MQRHWWAAVIPSRIKFDKLFARLRLGPEGLVELRDEVSWRIENPIRRCGSGVERRDPEIEDVIRILSGAFRAKVDEVVRHDLHLVGGELGNYLTERHPQRGVCLSVHVDVWFFTVREPLLQSKQNEALTGRLP
jgi:hypothetical protein